MKIRFTPGSSKSIKPFYTAEGVVLADSCQQAIIGTTILPQAKP